MEEISKKVEKNKLNPQARIWLASLNTTCNRLTTQYHTLLRSACNKSGDNRSGGAMVRLTHFQINAYF